MVVFMKSKKALKNVKYSLFFFILTFFLNFINRKIFIEILGIEYNGLNSLFINILSMLNLVELGVGSAMTYALYKPVAEDNKEKIVGIINFYKKISTLMGIIILLIGILIIPIVLILTKQQIPNSQVIIAYLIYLVNVNVGYYFIHKIVLLQVNQQMYLISFVDGICKTIKYLIQMLILIIYKSYIIFLLIEVVTNTFYYIWISKLIKRNYGWIKDTKGILNDNDKSDIYGKVKALAIHKLSGFIVFGTDYLLMSIFGNLAWVGIYSNYMMILNFVKELIYKIFDSIVASIGILITEKDSEKTYVIFKRIFFFNFWIVSFLIIGIYNTIDYFITIWIGKEYIINNYILILMLINLYITLLRPSVEKFKESAGVYDQDKNAAILEAIVNFVASILLSLKFGVVGVVFGTVVSNICILFWVKPYVTFKYVFNRSSKEYFKMFFKYTTIGLIILLITNYINNFCNMTSNLFLNFSIMVIINTIVVNILYIIIFRRTDEFKYYYNFILTRLRRDNR